MQPSDSNKTNELQSLLADERSRCNQHKQVYQALKDKYESVEEELNTIHQQLQDAVEQNNVIKASKDSYIKKLEQTVKKKQDEINNLSEKILLSDPEKNRERILNEVSAPFQDAITQLQIESDDLREKYNSLHYEHTVLKSQRDYTETEHCREIDLLKMQHVSEIRELTLKIEVLENYTRKPVTDYSTELQAAQKEVVKLSSKFNVLLAETEELRAQNEKVSMQLERNSRLHSKQLTEHLANIRVLESEKASVLMQKDVLQKELSSNQEERNVLNIRFQDMKQELLSITSQLEDTKYKYELHMANFKLEAQKNNIEHEAVKAQLEEEINSLKSETENLRMDVNTHLQHANEKEQILQQQLVVSKQHSIKKISELNHEKERLELKCSEIEAHKNEEIAQVKENSDILKNNLESAFQQNRVFEKELTVLRSGLEKNKERENTSSNDLEKQSKEIQLLKQKLDQLMSDGYSDQKRLLVDLSSKKYADSNYEEIIQLRCTLEKQKHEYQQRINSLECQLAKNNTTWMDEKKDIQNKSKQYARLITKLRDKLEIEKNHLEEIEVENEILRKNVPIEEHMQLKKKLKDLQRKQEEFHQVMIAALPYASSPVGTSHFERKIPFSPLPHQPSDNGLLVMDRVSDVIDNIIKKTDPERQKTSKTNVRQRRKKSLKLLKSEAQTANVHHTSSSDIENL